MKHLLSVLLLFITSSCASTPTYVYECVKKVQVGFNLRDGEVYEWHHEALTAKSQPDAVRFFSSMGNQNFYCTELTWRRDHD